MILKKKKEPSLLQAFVPILFLVSILALNVIYFGDASLDGPNQLALLFSATVAGFIGYKNGYTWTDIEKGMVDSIGSAMSSILILLLIGALAGTWLISGIVPSMIYYGLKILNPTIFLFAACIVCSVVSLATGSSWSTIATIGIALLGIGDALGMSKGMVAGAIISGAYFGDKISPLSDTTNLAPAMAGTDLFTHIRYMMHTTIPTYVITLVLFLILGFTTASNVNTANVNEVLEAIDATFHISPVLFLVPVGVVFMIVKKVPALPALLFGALLGGIFAVIFQPGVVHKLSGIMDDPIKSSYMGVLKAMSGTVNIETSNKAVSDLLSSKGMYGMMKTIWLILCAMAFGGVMEVSGLLAKITQSIIRFVHSTGSLVLATASTCVIFNATASDQYIAIVVPGRMYASTYRQRGYKPELLSRTLEDAGTVTSVLIPWNTCGATQASILNVATGEYMAYCFFNILSPIMTVIFAYLQIKIRRIPLDEMDIIKKEMEAAGKA